MDELIERLSKEVEQAIAPFANQVLWLDTIPGVDRRMAEALVSEIGVDMSRFGSSARLASWAGMCPGRHESAGKSRGGKTRKGSKWLRTHLTQAVNAAARTKGTYLSAQYARLRGRRGAARATIAVAHSILVAAFHILERQVPYEDLGDDWFLRRHSPERHARKLVGQLVALGYHVTLDSESADVRDIFTPGPVGLFGRTSSSNVRSRKDTMRLMGGTFSYANPPVIHCGASSISTLAGELDRLRAQRVAVVTTRSVAGDEAVIGRVRQALGGRTPVGTATIKQHAPVADIAAAQQMAVDEGADAVVSVGGGSPIDAAKVVAIRAGERRSGSRPLPHVAVPTTLSVAELASGAGMTDEAGNKVGLRDPRGLPDVVIYDAELGLQTPMDLWLSTGIRALDHAVEGFLADGEHPFSDVMCLEGARRLFKSLPEARANPGDAAIRTENQLAAWFSYTLPAQTAAGLSHVMGKQIGARHGIPHGVTSCLLLPHVMRYRAHTQGERLAALGFALCGGRGATDAADAIQELVGRLGLPQHFAAFDLREADLRLAAEEIAAASGGRHAPGDLFQVYLAAL